MSFRAVFGRWHRGLGEIPDCLSAINAAVTLTWFSTGFYVHSAVDSALFSDCGVSAPIVQAAALAEMFTNVHGSRNSSNK